MESVSASTSNINAHVTGSMREMVVQSSHLSVSDPVDGRRTDRG